jgi:8-oxo-dGTP pyrophosphatase MutT (NUDIX family)
MERLFTMFLSQYGLIVVGFGGFDLGVMRPLEKIANPAFLRKGLYWTYRLSSEEHWDPNPLLRQILDQGVGNVVTLPIGDADTFFRSFCEGVFEATTERREVIAEPVEVHVSGVCIRDGVSGLEVLLGRRSAGKQLYPNLWHCGGGALRFGENFVEAVIRECRTEFGVDVEPLAPIRTYEIAVPELHQKKIPGVVFLCQAVGYTNGTEPEADGTDVVDWKWQPISQVADLEMIPTLNEDIRMAASIYNTLRNHPGIKTAESLAVHAAAICLRRTEENIEVLLAKRSEDRLLYPGLWDGGGGIVLRGESFEQAVTRELREEVGAIIRPVVPINTYFLNEEGGVPGVVFLCEVIGYAVGNEPTPDGEEVANCQWVMVTDLEPFEFVPGVRRDIELAVRVFSSRTE